MTHKIDLPDKLDTAMAAGLAQRLATIGDGAVDIDGRRVQMLGALCAQILCAAMRDLEARGQNVHLTPSETMRDDLALLGLTAHFAARMPQDAGDTP